MMSYANKAAAKPIKKKDPPEQKKVFNKSQEQDDLLKFIKNLRIGNQSTSQTQIRVQKPARQKVSIFNKLTEGIRALVIREEETTEEKANRLKNTVLKFESPFIWKPIYKKFTTRDESLISKLHEKDEEIVDEKKFKWRKFILQLVISYELYLANRVPEAMEAVLKLENTLIENEDSVEWLFLGIKEALWHVVQTSKAFLFLEQNLIEEADKTLDCVQPVRTMRRSGRAGMHGIRAAVFMEYGPEGNTRALPEAKQALELDETTPEWHFLLGKCMGRVRRFANCHDMVNHLEVKSLNIANDLDKQNPLYRIYLAQVIRERTFRIYKKDYPEIKSKERKKIEGGFRAAYYQYVEALEMRPNCPHILTRCAYGLMKLPFQYVNLKLVRECLDKALELSPNNMMTHHIKGLYLERFDVDAEAALKEITTAAALGNFGASMDLVRMRYLLKRGDPIEELEEVASLFADPACVQVAYTQAGSYFLFVKHYFVDAIKYFTKVINIDLDSYAMKSHKSLFMRFKDPVNLFEVLLEELDKNTNWGSFAMDESKLLKRFRIRILKHDTPESSTNRLTVAELVEMSRNNFEKHKRKWQKLTAKKDKWSWNGNIKLKRKYKQSRPRKVKKNKLSVENSGKPINEQEIATGNSQANEKVRKPRSNSVTSVSSVDSDYQRDSYLHGPRELFINDDLSGSHESASTNRCPSTDALTASSNLGRFSIHCNRLRSCRSRDSSVCSMSSDEHEGSSPSDFQSNSLQEFDIKVSNKTEERLSQLPLTIKRWKPFDCARSDYLMPQPPSASSMDYKNERLSVMDRVKQSYAMLHRDDKRWNQSQKKSLQRTESTKSLNKGQYEKGGTISRSDSSQSLNIEVASLTAKLERCKPFGSRDSSVGSSRSLSFMPNFAKNDNNRDSK